MCDTETRQVCLGGVCVCVFVFGQSAVFVFACTSTVYVCVACVVCVATLLRKYHMASDDLLQNCNIENFILQKQINSCNPCHVSFLCSEH